jgi:CheY-like chemotaxis protein
MHKVQGKTILIVEDDPDIGELYSQILSEETPYEVIVVNHPLKAFEKLTTLSPFLFILNYHLPLMNGIELYDKLHAISAFSHIPAIMVSATLPKDQLLARGIRFLDKPMDVEAFLTLLEETIS